MMIVLTGWVRSAWWYEGTKQWSLGVQMLSALITRDMCNERKKCTAPGGSPLQRSHIVTILAADLRPSDTDQISYNSQLFKDHLSVYFPYRLKFNTIKHILPKKTPKTRQSNSTGLEPETLFHLIEPERVWAFLCVRFIYEDYASIIEKRRFREFFRTYGMGEWGSVLC